VWPTFDFASILTFRPTGPADDDLPRNKLMWSFGGTMDDQLISLTGENTYTAVLSCWDLGRGKTLSLPVATTKLTAILPVHRVQLSAHVFRLQSGSQERKASKHSASVQRIGGCPERKLFAVSARSLECAIVPWRVLAKDPPPSFDVSNHPDRAEIVWLKP